MKKFYEYPSMDISRFDDNDLITISETTEPQSANDKAEATLTNNGATQITTVVW